MSIQVYLLVSLGSGLNIVKYIVTNCVITEDNATQIIQCRINENSMQHKIMTILKYLPSNVFCSGMKMAHWCLTNIRTEHWSQIIVSAFLHHFNGNNTSSKWKYIDLSLVNKADMGVGPFFLWRNLYLLSNG